MVDIITPLLQPAINLGLNEFDFWNMTVGEIMRWTDGAIWRMKQQASFDYQLANLIGLSNSRILSDQAKYPPIEEVYPDLFDKQEKDKEEAENEERTLKSINNFMAFAMKHNSKKEVNQ